MWEIVLIWAIGGSATEIGLLSVPNYVESNPCPDCMAVYGRWRQSESIGLEEGADEPTEPIRRGCMAGTAEKKVAKCK